MPSYLTLADVAALARVRRPVVSVWRRRSLGGPDPFPAAHRAAGGRDVFDLDEVLDWLERTGRGNNPDARADAAAHALFDSGAEAVATGEALSALLTLRHLHGRALPGDADDLLDLADVADPDDVLLFRELRRAPALPALVGRVESLVEACWGVAAAHERVLAARFRVGWTPLVDSTLAAEALRLLADLVVALLRDGADARLVVPTGCGVDVLPAVVAAEARPVLLMAGDGPVHRLTRRQLVLEDAAVQSIDRRAGQWAVEGPVVHLAVVPDGDHPDHAPDAVLALVGEVAEQMDDRQAAVVFGPASALADALPDGPALGVRDDLLRGGRVRAIVRLPQGLVPARPREHAALWLLAAGDARALAERRPAGADLSHLALTRAVVGGLVDDLLAASQGAQGARRRAWAHLAHVATPELVSRSGSLVQARRRPAGSGERSGVDWVLALRAADADLGLLEGWDLAPARGTPVEVTAEEASLRGWLAVLPGNRLAEGLPPGGVPVLGPAEVAGEARVGVRTVDRLAATASGDVRFTEPGDLVFTTAGRPRAVLDREGGALVEYPARILRLRAGAPLVRSAVLARINAAPHRTPWRAWTFAVLPDPDASALGATLDAVAAARASVLESLAKLDALASDLTTAVETRRLRIERKEHDGQGDG